MSSWHPAKRRSSLPEWLHAPLRLGVIGAVLAGAGLLAFALLYFWLSLEYDLAEVGRLPSRTLIFDRHGEEIDAGGGVQRSLITRDQIPDFMVKALLAREDARFFDHCGIDVRGLARATLRNLKDRSFTQGASTLSMQLARNSFGIRAKSLHRKFLEIAITLRLETRYSKDEILAHYLNRIYFGSGCDGVEAAARTYFGKTTSELNRAECATLVGIIRGPHVFSPFRNLPAALDQRDQVLDRMIACDYLRSDEAAAIRETPLELVPPEQRHSERSYALQRIIEERDLILDDEDIQNGGLRIATTLDARWQMRLEIELMHTADALEAGRGWSHPTHETHTPGEHPRYLQTSAVTLEKGSGAILALIGGRDFFDSRFDRSSRARRDLGTAFEPFLAAAAAERGKLVIPGHPLQTGRQIGAREAARLVRRLGIRGPFAEGDDLFRGSAAASPVEAAIALATLASGGQRPEPFIIREIADASGRVLFTRSPETTQAITADAANDALSVFDRRGSSLTHTGATHSGRDAWLSRIGPSGTTAAWLGFDQPTRIADGNVLTAALEDLAERLDR